MKTITQLYDKLTELNQQCNRIQQQLEDDNNRGTQAYEDLRTKFINLDDERSQIIYEINQVSSNGDERDYAESEDMWVEDYGQANEWGEYE